MLSVVYFIVIQSVDILSVIILSIFTLSVIVLSYIMLSVLSPSKVDLLVPTSLHQVIIYLRFNKKASFMRRSIVLSFTVQLEVPALGKADGQNWSRKLYKT
jgi:hypothetical protein